jgi:uncharacterized protein (DUF362 family)
MKRRTFTRNAGLAAAGAAGLTVACWDTLKDLDPRASKARVAVLHPKTYGGPLSDWIRRGIAEFRLPVKGKSVLLKPNLVEYHATRRINTNPLVVAAAVEAFRQLGASSVTVAEGPGHQRDTEMLLEVSGLGEVLDSERVPFVDLNTDAIRPVAIRGGFTKLKQLWLPETVLAADLVVSMPKMKTHHWAGVTLSLKNLFGVIPGVRYGWPKNVLHWNGIPESIADIAATVKPGFTIIDGIEGMQGNGPLHGEAVDSGVLVLSDNLTAADATASRLMGLDPLQMPFIGHMRSMGEPAAEHRIVQIGEPVASHRRDYQLIESWRHLRA